MSTDPSVLLQGCFNQVLGVSVQCQWYPLATPRYPTLFNRCIRSYYYPIACTMSFGLDITSSNFWEELEIHSAARDGLESFLLLADAMVQHTYMLHVGPHHHVPFRHVIIFQNHCFSSFSFMHGHITHATVWHAPNFSKVTDLFYCRIALAPSSSQIVFQCFAGWPRC